MKKEGLTQKQKTVIVLAAVLLIVAALVLIYIWEKNNSSYTGDIGVLDENGVLEYDGEKYYLRGDVDTVLVMGIDKFDDMIVDDDVYINNQQADFMMLLIIDRKTDKCSAIHINRDTMAEMNVLGIGGKKVGTTTGQIALAHTYGSGEKDSCKNTVDAVSRLLCGIPIDHYVSLTMDAVPIINDAVDGVEVNVLDDLTRYDPALKAGENVTLMGEQSLYYVRYRYGLEDSTNESRMERQRQYLNALYTKVMQYINEDKISASELVLEVSDYMVSDMSATKMDDTLDSIEEYSISEIHTYEGETRVTEHVEFYPDKKSVTELVIKLFFKTKK